MGCYEKVSLTFVQSLTVIIGDLLLPEICALHILGEGYLPSFKVHSELRGFLT